MTLGYETLRKNKEKEKEKKEKKRKEKNGKVHVGSIVGKFIEDKESKFTGLGLLAVGPAWLAGIRGEPKV